MSAQLNIFDDQPRKERQPYRSSSQNARVLNYMQRYGSITTMEAFDKLGVTRLARCIGDLEEAGIKIRHEPRVKVLNRFGKEVYVTRYHLVGWTGGTA